jgi:hypothetical protein
MLNPQFTMRVGKATFDTSLPTIGGGFFDQSSILPLNPIRPSPGDFFLDALSRFGLMLPAILQNQLVGFGAQFSDVNKRLDKIETTLGDLASCREFVIPLTTLAPEPFELLSDIPVTIEGADGDFTATFYEASLGASGDTVAEAIANFKETLIRQYELFEELPAERVSNVAARQRDVIYGAMARNK